MSNSKSIKKFEIGDIIYSQLFPKLVFFIIDEDENYVWVKQPNKDNIIRYKKVFIQGMIKNHSYVHQKP